MQLVEYGGLDKTPVQPQTKEQEASQEQRSEDVKKAVRMKELPVAPANSSINLDQPQNDDALSRRPPGRNDLLKR